MLSGPRRQLLTLPQPESAVAVAVDRMRQPGTDPEQTDAHTVLHIWLIQGTAQLEEEAQPTVSLEPATVYFCVDQQPAESEPAAEVPVWLRPAALRGIDRDASRFLEPTVATQQPILDALQAAAYHRRPEVQALAAGCLSHVDQFAAVVDALNDEKQRSWWSMHFQTLQDALSRSRESAAAVRRTLQERRGADAGALYRLLWGYSDEELRGGAAAELVGYLAHEALDFRVLSIETLQQITGKTLGYSAWLPERQRRRAVAAWQKLEKAGQVAHRVPFSDPTSER